MIFIGIDLGTTGVRVLAVNGEGRPMALATGEYPVHVPQPGWTEQSPQDWWMITMEALQSVVKQLGRRAQEIKGVGVTGQMHGSVFLDSSSAVIRPAILWNDQRTAAQARRITERIGAERLLRLTGNQSLTGFTAPKILWLRENEPAAFIRVKQILLPKDYIRFRITGQYATDVSDASGTLLFDVAGRTWSQEVCDSLEIPAEWLPPACEGPKVTGEIIPGISTLTGIPSWVPVVAGGGDQAAGAIGVGLVAQGNISVSVGTSGVVFAASDTPAIDPQGRLHSFCHAAPGKWHVMGVMLAAGGSLRWIRDTLYPAGTSYDDIAAEAESVPAGAEGLLFAPYLSGERTPHADPDARGAFVGLGLHHTRAHLARAALEGIAFGLRDSLELARDLGIDAGELRITGGGARSGPWRRIMAAVFGRPLRRLEIDEGPALGAAILAAVGSGDYPDVAAACEAMVRPAEAEALDQELASRYDEIYPAFRQAYPVLKPLYGALNRS